MLLQSTTIYFGKNSLAKLNDELPHYGETVMLKYSRIISLETLGATREMLPSIAQSTTIIDKGYRKLTTKNVLNILDACF
ncbi:hypothetical protein [Proteus penneri]|uniref:hypothetical protein n=2 Tax=Proteus penneri TaxID=102862 RepID=UPI001EFB2074|nr:hypothetical protein [Proteus penneri]